MASLDDVIENTGTAAWNNSFRYRVKSITNDVVLLHLANAPPQNTWHSGDHAIQYDQSTGIWSDVNNSTDPKYFTSTSTFANNTSLSGYPANIYCWSGDSTPILRLILIAPSWAQQPSSGDNGTNTEGFSYSGTLTVNASDLDYEVPGSSTAGTYQILSKYLPGGSFQLDISFTHVEGTSSSGSAVNFDSSKQWILRSPLGDVLDSAGATFATSKVFCNFW